MQDTGIGIPKDKISVVYSTVGISRFYLIIKQQIDDLIEQGLSNFIKNYSLFKQV